LKKLDADFHGCSGLAWIGLILSAKIGRIGVYPRPIHQSANLVTDFLVIQPQKSVESVQSVFLSSVHRQTARARERSRESFNLYLSLFLKLAL